MFSSVIIFYSYSENLILGPNKSMYYCKIHLTKGEIITEFYEDGL